MPLNIHLLRIFMAVATTGSFRRAAETLHISQPAVSKAVQALEQQLHATLIDRAPRGLSLTATGKTLLPYAQQLFAVERAAEAALRDLDGLQRGRLAIGASSTIGIYLLPDLLGAFHRRYPGITLFLDIGNTQQVVERLQTLPLDMALVEGPVTMPNLTITPWRDDRLVIIAGPQHRLVTQQPVSLTQVQAEPLLMREPGSGTREVVEVALRAQQIVWDITMELGSTEAIKRAVTAGLGLAIVSEATVAHELALGLLVVLDVPGLAIQRPLTQVRVTGQPTSQALEAFAAIL